MILHPFQNDGVSFLWKRRLTLLADQMGLGKTPQTIRALDCLGDTQPLVVCPAIAKEHWRCMFRDWSMMQHTPTIVSYDYARENVRQLSAHQWDALVVDEMHFTKSIKAKRTNAIWGKGNIAWHADKVMSLSGTPAPNHYGELFPIMTAYGAWRGTYHEFIARYCILDDMGKVVANSLRYVDELRAILDQFMIRRLKKDVASELPPVSIHPWYVKSDPDLLDVIRPGDSDRVAARMRKEDAQLKLALHGLTEDERMDYLRSKQTHYATWRRINSVMKCPAVLSQLLFEFDNQLVDKVVVYAYHRDAIVLLRDMLKGKGINVACIWGGTDERKRIVEQDKFKRWQRGVFIGQIVAAGTAIDLTSAHEGIMLEKSWVPGENAQAMERMHRYGQAFPVTIRDVTIRGSVDEDVSRTLDRKMRELSALFDEVKP